jgi:8-oxo-dGTP pyrophosphatase MutT (NUDIX family)
MKKGRYEVRAMTDHRTFHLGVKALLQNEDGEVLLLEVNPDRLSDDDTAYADLPGGRIEERDLVEETLLREVEEETGIDPEQLMIGEEIDTSVSNIEIPVGDGEKVGLILSTYRCELAVPADEVDIRLSDEYQEYAWVPKEELTRQLTFKFADSLIEELEDLG